MWPSGSRPGRAARSEDSAAGVSAAIGTRAGTTVTATRVFVPAAANPPAGATPGSSSPTTVAHRVARPDVSPGPERSRRHRNLPTATPSG